MHALNALCAGSALTVFAAAPPAEISASAPAVAFAHFAEVPFPELKTRLERAGWPATHVQAFLNAEIQRRLNPAPELKASDLRPFEFWRTGPDAQPVAPADARASLQEQSRREEAARQTFDALFPPTPSTPATAALLAWEEQRRWGTLAPEKRSAVATRLDRAQQARQALFDQRGGMLTRDEWNVAWKIVEEARADLAHLLTEEELFDFDLRNSNTAEQMRTELDNFQPSRAEFIALFKLRHPLERSFGHKPPGIDVSIDRQRIEAEASVQKQIATALGAERYDDYRISLQPACQTLQFDGRFARSDAATVRKLYRSLVATKARLAQVAAAPSGPHSATAAALKEALYREFRAVLDEEGTRRYLQEQSLWP